MNRTCRITVKYHEGMPRFIKKFEEYLERKKQEDPIITGMEKSYVLRTDIELTYRMVDGEIRIKAMGPRSALEKGVLGMMAHYGGVIKVDYEIPVSSEKGRNGWGLG